MILTVTLNPSLDEEYLLPTVEPGRWNSAEQSQRTPGGSGVNIAIMLRQLGMDVLATGFVAGYNGDALLEGLRERGVTTNFSVVEGETRTNVNMIDLRAGIETCILEKGPTVTRGEGERFFSSYRRMLRRCEAAVIGGSLPPGLGADFYLALAEAAAEEKLPLYVNAEGELTRAVASFGPRFVNVTPRHRLARGEKADQSRALALAKEAVAGGALLAVATCGEDGELFAHASGCWLARLPTGTPVSSLFTFDDALTAGAVWALQRGLPVEEAVRFAIACAAEDCRHTLKGLRGRQAVEAQLPYVTLERID